MCMCMDIPVDICSVKLSLVVWAAFVNSSLLLVVLSRFLGIFLHFNTGFLLKYNGVILFVSLFCLVFC